MSLALHNLKANRGARRSRKRLGRGNASGHGTTATRGTKGQRARQGGRKGLIQFGAKHFVSHLPKVRGFESFKAQPQVVTVGALGKFKAG
ncbi:MAG: uL15 family ribosomal protein, partial [Candidatus Veblenbacteria bacterium]|nr:uL15 family ribosomal protein [Candidatus Veblenbacteria bacterium]